MANKRFQLIQEDLDAALSDVGCKLLERAKQKGLGTMASNHEILGIIVDEVQEYRDEVHAKPSETCSQETIKIRRIEELKDIAVAAIFGIASIESGGVDW